MVESTVLEERFKDLRMAIKEGIDDLKTATKEGFGSLLAELKLSREQGHIPIPVLERILASQNEVFKEARKSSDESYSKALRALYYVVGALLAWVTGMKYFLPDSPMPGTLLNPAKIIQEIRQQPVQQPALDHPEGQ